MKPKKAASASNEATAAQRLAKFDVQYIGSARPETTFRIHNRLGSAHSRRMRKRLAFAFGSGVVVALLAVGLWQSTAAIRAKARAFDEMQVRLHSDPAGLIIEQGGKELVDKVLDGIIAKDKTTRTGKYADLFDPDAFLAKKAK